MLKNMKWIEAKVLFEFENSDLAVEVISNLFYESGFRGVLIEDPDLQPPDGWGAGAVNRPRQPAVIGFLPLSQKSRDRCGHLYAKLRRLEDLHGIITQLALREIDEEDWAQSWKAFFKPVRVCSRIVVKPSWEDFVPEPLDIVIDIDPGMAFGTGSHPTTVLSLALINTYLQAGDSFLDVGVGSGILAIAAAKLGAKKIWGVDNDETAVAIAAQNLQRNQIEPERYRLICGNLTDDVEGRFDIVAANILADVILELLPGLERVLKPDGIFICSGVIEAKKDKVIRAMQDTRFEILEDPAQEGWVAAAGKLK
jgi:ribosomal protein L11 methyltransferase